VRTVLSCCLCKHLKGTLWGAASYFLPALLALHECSYCIPTPAPQNTAASLLT
jgi:hypothetical protein